MKKNMIVIFCLLPLCGCSVSLMDKPFLSNSQKSVANNRAPQCTESEAAPIADTLIAAGGAVATGFLIADASKKSWHNIDGSIQAPPSGYGAVATGLTTLIFAGSAISGYKHAAHCSSIKNEFIIERAAFERVERKRASADALALKEAEQLRQLQKQEAEQIVQEEKRRQVAEVNHQREEHDKMCSDNSYRFTNIDKLVLHFKIKSWVGDNCKNIPISGNVCSVINGKVACKIAQTGSVLTCAKNGRPIKFDGSNLSDANIKSGNLATNLDDVKTWTDDQVFMVNNCPSAQSGL